MFKTKLFEEFMGQDFDVKVVRMVKPARLYLRFGLFQSETNERSLNWHTGEYERGISVYNAILRDDRVRVTPEWICDVYDATDIFKDRIVFALTGKEVGTGSDGEPLLAPSSITVRGFSVPSGESYGLDCRFDFE